MELPNEYNAAQAESGSRGVDVWYVGCSVSIEDSSRNWMRRSSEGTVLCTWMSWSGNGRDRVWEGPLKYFLQAKHICF
jgi:hypothetical protein